MIECSDELAQASIKTNYQRTCVMKALAYPRISDIARTFEVLKLDTVKWGIYKSSVMDFLLVSPHSAAYVLSTRFLSPALILHSCPMFSNVPCGTG